MPPIKKRGLHILRSISIIALALVILTTLMPAIAYAQSGNTTITNAYDYPIKPGTEQWKSFTTHDQMLKACQIPTTALSKMSTTALVDTVLNYPLLGDMMAYDDIQEGFNAVATRFNGLSALLQRNDAGTALLAKYKEMNPLTVLNSNLTDLQKGAYSANLIYIETILAQGSIQSKLTEAQRQDLITEAATKLQALQTLPEIYGGISRETTTSVIAQATQYTGYVYTPKRTAVSVTFDRPEFSASRITSLNNYVAQNYPQAKRLSDASNRYNCHSYAWYSQNTKTNNVWMDNPSAYCSDGSYRQVALESGIWVKKASWRSADHSGIVITVSTAGGGIYKYQSKWGIYPLMEHQLWNCPYSSWSVLYYTR